MHHLHGAARQAKRHRPQGALQQGRGGLRARTLQAGAETLGGRVAERELIRQKRKRNEGTFTACLVRASAMKAVLAVTQQGKTHGCRETDLQRPSPLQPQRC